MCHDGMELLNYELFYDGEGHMNILVTLNSNYIKPLKVMLKSLFINNAGEKFCIYVMHSRLSNEETDDINRFIADNGSRSEIIKIDDRIFENAPVIFHYPREMYYRLLAYKFLPKDIDRILYLDPDILVLNPVKGLYNTDLSGYIYAAAYHDVISIREINKLRLNPYEIEAYYNSGVLLINLELQRELVDEKIIYEFVEKNKAKLIMPDQDVLNALYAKRIRSLDEKLYNYDSRYYSIYKLKSKWDMDMVINYTVFLHFCGKRKPWNKDYSGRFHALYKHYEKLALK